MQDNVYVLDHFRLPNNKPLREAFGAIQLLVRNRDGSWKSIMRLSPREVGNVQSAYGLVGQIKSQIARQHTQLGAHGEWILSIPPLGRSGFPIGLYGLGAAIQGTFGELHEEFTSLDEAFSWVRKAASNEYQLVTVSIGDLPLECRLEPVANAKAPDVLATGYPIPFKRFRRKKVSIKRNCLVDRP